jgi:hypothetical protein
MNLMMDSFFKNWQSTTSGSGSTSVTNGTLTASAAAGGDQGYLITSMAPQPGETYIFSVEAKILTNNGVDPNCGIFVDYPTIPSAANQLNFDDSGTWRRYELTFTVPLDSISDDLIIWGAGSWGATDGSCEIRAPKVRSLTTSPVSQSIWSSAQVDVSSSGVVTINDQFNLVDAVWTSGGGSSDSVLTVSVNPIGGNLINQPRPRVYTGSESPASYIAKAPSEITNKASGTFDIKIYDTSTGLAIQSDPSADTSLIIDVLY